MSCMTRRKGSRPPTNDTPGDDSAVSDSPSQQNSKQQSSNRQESSPSPQQNRSDADQLDRSEQSSTTGSVRSTPNRPPSTENPVQLLTHLGSAIGGMFKFLFYAAVIALVGYLLWQHRDRVKMAWLKFLDEMRQLWGRLFGRPAGTPVAPDNQPVPPQAKPRPFSDFADPFATKLAMRYSASELVKYSFEALEAWARERGCPRQLDQTPTEFARQIGRHRKDLGTDARNLALLYSRAAYAQGSLPASTSQQLKQLWSQLV